MGECSENVEFGKNKESGLVSREVANFGIGGIGGMSPSDGNSSGYASPRCESRDGGGVIDGALLPVWDFGELGSSVASLKPSRYIEIASSTLIPRSIPKGVSGVSGERSVIELLLVRTLLRSVPLVCSMLERQVSDELTLGRGGVSSVVPFVGKRDRDGPWRFKSCGRPIDSCVLGRLLFNLDVDMDIRSPPRAGIGFRCVGHSYSSRRGQFGGLISVGVAYS